MHGWVSAVGAKVRERSAAVRAHATRDGRAVLARRAARIRLLPAVATAIVAGLCVAVGAYTVLRWITPTSKAEAAPIDITKVSLTVVAGVGGVVALVIAYRRQRDLEQSRLWTEPETATPRPADPNQQGNRSRIPRNPLSAG
ncbi:hypothetical protein [Nocardia wallacei]|uniref:hypothetical protein n=1 Tax=Nocardia wallacei TaxID=480035 RepID=UPI002455CCE2|nr:hypothetical protein [Nocardia wallacei]